MAKATEAFTESRVTAPEVTKFMEFIVQECIDIVNDAVDHREPASTYANKISQHFGVTKIGQPYFVNESGIKVSAVTGDLVND
jgi:hypothetical protein